ncbi:MAG: glycosyltransferase family 39 protein [Chlamydiae bacterium]|nr:glycosyltransferase family 39 protein [Chlamydiota bacterium]MBI3276156.1 glycosyltransferase family 39 protein [Chlamydiota bacterium]
MKQEIKRSMLSLRSILFLAVMLRGLWGMVAFYFTRDASIFYSPDSASYVALAKEMITLHHFSIHGIPELVRTPGYPLFLIPGLILGHLEWVTISLQILLSGWTLYLIYKTAFLFYQDKKTALICAFLFAVEPLSILYSVKILTETLFTFILMAGIYGLVQFLNHRSVKALLFSSISFSLATYIRPISYYLTWVIFVFLLFFWFLKCKRAKDLFCIFLFLLISVGSTALWQIRNNSETGYSGFSAITDINLYFYQGASILSIAQNRSYHEIQDSMGYHDQEIYYKSHPDQKFWNQGKIYQYLKKEGLKIVLEYPLRYFVIHLKGMFRVLWDPGTFEYLKMLKIYPSSGGLLAEVVDQGIFKMARHIFLKQPRLFLLCLLMGVVPFLYFSLGVLGFFLKPHSPISGLLILTSSYFWALSGGPHAVSRFRHPIMPLIIIFAGQGVSYLLERIKKKYCCDGS